MLKSILAFVHLSTLFFVSDATTVAVLEFGKGGVTRRITSASPVTSVAGVSSFWNTVHDEVVQVQTNKKNKKISRRVRVTQYPGMTVVPDLFKRADGGLAIGVTGNGVDLAAMPTLNGILNGDNAVGQFRIEGAQTQELMKKAGGTSATTASAFEETVNNKVSSVTSKATGNKLESVLVAVEDNETATKLDQTLASLLQSLETLATESGSTVLLHIILDDETDRVHRRLKNDNNNQNQQNQNQNNNNNNNNNNQQNNQQSQYLQKYGYGAWAYTKNNELVTNVRTIFQIQYFNIVLWTAIGLSLVLLIVIFMMINMPFMPDTLLFGESAKMVAE